MDTANTSSTMSAYRYHPGVDHPVQETVPVPTPGENEVLVKVLAAGVCGSDYSIFKGTFNLPPIAFTAGHEGVGVVHFIGPSVEEHYPELETGTYVAVLGWNPCMQETCPLCSSRKDNLCRLYPWFGVGGDGLWAPYCVLPAGALLIIPGDPTSIPPAIAAASTDAVLTPYHAMRTVASIQPEQTVLIVGCGGLGYNAIQIAKNCLGVNCIVVSDVRESSLEAAIELGATHAVHPDKLGTLIEEQKLTIDVVVDIVGTDASFQTAVSAAAKWATIVLVGMGSKTVALPIVPSAQKELTVRSSLWGCKEDLKEVLQAVKDGRIVPRVQTRPMHECVGVLKDLGEGKLKERVALIP